MTNCVRLTDRAVVEVAGEDRTAFLQGLLSQSVEGLAAGDVRYGGLLTPQGRLLFADPRAGGAQVDIARLDPRGEAMRVFREILQDAGLVVTTRKTRGDDIDAACGQLAGEVLDRTDVRSRQAGRVIAIQPDRVET